MSAPVARRFLAKPFSLWLLLTLLLSLLAGWPLLFGSGIINTRAGGDSPFLLVRVYELVSNLQAGVFPSRWMPDAAYGLGYPFFSYYAHLPYYLAALLKIWGVGYIWSIRLTQIIGLLAAGATMYLYLRRLTIQPVAASLGAIAYTYAPFHLVNLYVRGDSLAEFYAFVFYPLIFWAILAIKEKPTRCNIALLALSYGGLVFSHNISALIFTPFLMLYMLFIFLGSEGERTPSLRAGIFGMGLGLALAGFYWLPALIEGGEVHLHEATTGYFNYANHFRGWDLVQQPLIFDYEITRDRDPFRMGLAQSLAILGSLGILSFAWLRNRKMGRQGWALLSIFFGSTFFIIPLSRPLWDSLPLLPFVQFPWRLLSVQALAGSGLIALALHRFPWPQAGGAFIGSLLIISQLLSLQPEYLSINEPDITQDRLLVYEYFTANIGSTVRNEYLPQGIETRPFTSPWLISEEAPTPIAIQGELDEARLLLKGPDSQEWEVTVASPEADLAFPLYWFPGWQAYVDGQPRETEAVAGLGYLQSSLEEGTHRVLLRLERTPLRLGAEMISLIALVGVAMMLWREVMIHWRRLGFALGLIIAGGIILHMLPPPNGATSAEPSDLSMDFLRQPYLHHNPEGIRFEDQIRLQNYQFSPEEVQAGEELVVTVNWDRPSNPNLEAELAVVTPAAQLFSVPAAVAVSRMPISGTTTQHRLQIPPEAVPEIYLLRLRVIGEDGQLVPRNERGERLGPTYLRPVRILNNLQTYGDEVFVANFGERIGLQSIGVTRLVQQVRLNLVWMAAHPPVRNYALSFRFFNVDGQTLFSKDLQPNYGFFPTSAWPPGKLIPDSYEFDLPEGITIKDICSIEFVVYQVSDLAPLGTFRLHERARWCRAVD